MELVSTYFWIPFVVAAAWGVYVYFFPTERLPNVEFIRICDKPGKAGNADDVQAFLDDSLSAIMKGYNRVCFPCLLRIPDLTAFTYSIRNWASISCCERQSKYI